MKYIPSSILITGASSGLGRELALYYAKKNNYLFLNGRNNERLEQTARECEKLGAKTYFASNDVRNNEEMQAWINKCDKIKPLELAIINAGISGGTAKGFESLEQIREILSINIDGAINNIEFCAKLMKKRQKGQIAIISSLASYRGLPSAPSYSASKAAIRIYGEALRGLLSKDNIFVSVITPGYIKTPLTDLNKFPMPLLMPAKKAARIIATNLTRNPSRLAFPLTLYLIIWFLSCMPPSLTDFIFSKLPAKE